MTHVPKSSETHASNKKFLTRAYYLSRILVAGTIILSATLFPPFDSSHLITQPRRKFGFTSAVLRWDVFHFANIALNGYTHEHLFAFFPGTPFLMRLFAEAGLRVFNVVGFTDRTSVLEGDVLLGGAAASLLLCDWTGDLYDLTVAVGGTPSMAKLTTLLSLLPLSPSTLLFAPYAEPFFATLSYKGILACHRKKWIKATVCFMLATAFRSNGTMLAGFIIWSLFVEPLVQRLAKGKISLDMALVMSLFQATLYSFIMALPFILHQAHGYYSFCTAESFDPSSSFNYPPWCSAKPLPLIYGYVQKEYWDVGFLRYWRPSQIPNFLFAAPVMILLLGTSWKEVRDAIINALEGWNSYNGKRIGIEKRLQSAAQRVISCTPGGKVVGAEAPQRPRLNILGSFTTLPHAIHCLIFSLILLFASHVQIVLRLSSAMPYTYWAAASLMMQYKGSDGGRNWARIWVVYVVTWSFVSMVLWAAFLPPA
ncbi:glycosyltransferase family 76 protein [Tulasnella calospora MUT 4182]|uniref:GPI mannosyltransferase 2 n=1 Tax=Tulasnella calospora MUT 4182 TaxID=1051891 RepID=A0A0C3KQZ3_9AGAM|nr:glycosyltransferase family 76 protein [Tulasnella calospora MUT 4182]